VVTLTRALVEPSVSELSDLPVADRSGASILELPFANQSIQAERERIVSEFARELHDQLAQPLTALLVQTDVFMREQRGNRDVVDQLDYVKTSVREVLNNMRQILCDLRGEPGLSNSLAQNLAEGLLPTYQRRTGIKVNLWVSRSWPASLPPETSIHLYRIIQEALTNAHKHGAAGSVQVALQAARERLVVKIRDDGRGIAWIDEKPIGMGLVGMRERAALSGGLVSIRSRPGAGTTVMVSIPREALRWSPKHVLPAS
jgi:two-component system, NarL family, sensor histidine kinase DegS